MKYKKRLVITTALIIVFALLLAGCQQTPTQEPVVVKNSGGTQQAEKAAEQQSASPNYSYEVPGTLSSEFEEGKLSIHINAEIVAPSAPYPVAKIKPHAITVDEANRYVSAFFPEGGAYHTLSTQQATKQEIEDEIVRLKRGDSDLADEDKAAYNEMIAEDVAALEALYQSAPETRQQQEFSGNFAPQPLATPLDPYPYQLIYGENVETIDLTGKGLAGNEARLLIEKDGAGHSAFEYVEQRTGNRIGAPGDSVVQPLSEAKNLPKTTVEQAQQTAQVLLASLGLESYKMAGVGAALEGSYPEGIEEPQFEDFPKCYVFYFTPAKGMPVNYVSNVLDEVEYTRAWEYESLSVFVDDAGVCRVMLRAPSEQIETASQSVQLIGFEEIAKKIESGLANHYQPAEESVEKVDMTIDRIQLGWGRIAQNEDFSQCLLVPVWDVYGKMTITYVDDVGTEFDVGKSYLTINAMDGSVINRALGY